MKNNDKNNPKYDFPSDVHVEHFSQISSNSNILDIGCATGYNGEYLFKEKNCFLTGVDINPAHITSCKQRNCYKDLKLINLNMLKSELDDYVNSFDYILMLDVIEHLYNPVSVINKLKKLLAEKGRMIFSIPNISHASIKISLMQNKFRYTDLGLLDTTHIRFFTLETIIDLFNKTNMQINNIDFVFKPFCTNIDKDVCLKGQKYLKELEDDFESYVYQYIITASDIKKDNSYWLNSEKPIEIAKNQTIGQCEQWK